MGRAASVPLFRPLPVGTVRAVPHCWQDLRHGSREMRSPGLRAKPCRGNRVNFGVLGSQLCKREKEKRRKCREEVGRAEDLP